MQTRNYAEAKWNTLQQCALAAKKTNHNLGWVGKIAASRPREVLLRSAKTVSESLLNYWSFPVRQTPGHAEVQQRAIKTINRLQFLSNEVRLSELCLFSLKKRRLSRISPILCINNPMASSSLYPHLMSVVSGEQTRGSGNKLKSSSNCKQLN